MDFNLTSSNEIIARVMRDFKVDNINWKASGYDWIADGMSAINAWFAFENKEKTISVCNHKTPYPCDLVELIGVKYCGKKLPLGKNIARIPTCKDTLTCHNINMDVFNSEKLRELNGKVEQLENLQQLFTADPDNYELAEQIVNLTKQITLYTLPYANNYRNNHGLEYYNLNAGFVETTFEEGEITLIYTGAVSDKDGLPLIPDVYEFKEALAWFIVGRLLMGGYSHPVFSYEFVDRKWDILRPQARNKIKMPSIDRAEALLNMWTRPVFDRYLPDSFFESSGERTYIS